MRAIQLGARPVTWREAPAIMRERGERAAGKRSLADLAADSARSARESGDLARAASLTRSCSELDPKRVGLWQRREGEILAAARRAPLSVESAVRLATAGLGPDDPGAAQDRGVEPRGAGQGLPARGGAS